MPLTVITLKNSPASLRGDLTKWMQEISTGVYVGNFNRKIREKLWERVVSNIGVGEATISYEYRNEIGYKFETHNSNKIPIDFEGIPLVLNPLKTQKEEVVQKYGFSKIAKVRKTKKFSNINRAKKQYVVLDLETSGLDPIKDSIIEIGAVKVSSKIEEYSCLIKYDGMLSEDIKKLTNITDNDLKSGKDEKEALKELLEFIGQEIIIGYNINFDIKFLNETLKRHGQFHIKNKIYDVMKFVKQEKMFLKNYKLETVLKEFSIESKVSHRALEDAKVINKLIYKLNKLIKKLK